MQSLMQVARARTLRLMKGEVVAKNANAIALMRRFDFHIRTRPKDERVVWVGKDL